MIHTCTTCGNQGNWSPAWTWFGSFNDLENGKPILKFCSDGCRKQHAVSAAVFAFDGVGELQRHVTYSVHCGGCGQSDAIEENSAAKARRVASETGWTKHPVGGWLCATCSAAEQVRGAVIGELQEVDRVE